MEASEVLSRGVKIVGESLVAPGSSLILDGRIGKGGAHLVGGALATWVLGPVGWFLVAANSYSNSVTDRHLHKHFVPGRGAVEAGGGAQPATEPAS